MRSAQSAGSPARLRACSVRPGAPPATLMSTTGSPWRRNASTNSLACLMTSSTGCAVGSETMPFCKSMTTRAVFGSSVVIAMAFSLLDLDCGAPGMRRDSGISLGSALSSAAVSDEWACLRIDEPVEQFHCGRELLLLRRRERGSNGTEQPVFPRCAASLDPFPAGGSEGQG